ncbi:MAG: HAMP domain-containing histidine kinase [Proteobacteria bacterium]|nr:HAMP domain-containing histidine kinase [Pseudomonadota bacterium]
MAALSLAGNAATVLGLVRAARRCRGKRSRRLWAVAVGAVCGGLGGGGAVTAHVYGIASILWAAPPLLVAIGLVSYAVLGGEIGRRRDLIEQGLVYGLMTAVFSAFGVVAFFAILPYLAPGSGRSVAWLIIVVFFATLPLDGLRMLLVESSGRWLFRRPSGVRDLADEVDRSETRAEHAERLAEIGTMASAVAHEIRNPLGIIAAQAALLERRGAPASSVNALRQQVDRTRRFVDGLLRYGRPRPLRLGTVAVAAAIEHAITDVVAAASGTTPAFDTDLEAVRRAEIEADATAFGDVHRAILDNAVAALHGSERGCIDVRASADAEWIEIAISDNGPGVPKELENSLFEPFVTGRGRDSAHPGTGLGLAICARWLDRHGGSIAHLPAPAGGARFITRWPRRVS